MEEQSFSVPAENMLEAGRAVRLIFIDDQAALEAVDPDLDSGYAASWLLSLDTSQAWPTAQARQAQQEHETADVLNAMATGRQVHAVAKFYIEKVFKTDPTAPARRFLGNFVQATGSQAFMPVYLMQLYTLCSVPATKALLIAAGMTQAKIDEIKDAADDFNTEDSEQNAFIKQNAEATDARNKQYNSTYAFHQAVNRASKVAFYGNPIKLNQYAMPHGTPEETFLIEGKAMDGSNANAPMKKVLVEIVELGVSTYTNFYGNYGFIDIEPGTYTLRFSTPGYVTKTEPAVLVANGHVTANCTLVLA